MRPAPLPPGRLRLRHRALVIAEILAAYLPLMRRVRQNDLTQMVTVARTPSREPVAVPPDQAREAAFRLAQMTERVLGVLPTDRRCLITSLVVLRLLEHRCIPGRIVIGVGNDDGFVAHAWVEFEQEAVLPHSGFSRLTEM
jgi:hypothetical protein